MYNLLLEINETVGNVWEHIQPTGESVVISETITNKVVDSTYYIYLFSFNKRKRKKKRK